MSTVYHDAAREARLVKNAGQRYSCLSPGWRPWRPLADLATLATTGGLADWHTGGLDTCMLPRTIVVPLL